MARQDGARARPELPHRARRCVSAPGAARRASCSVSPRVRILVVDPEPRQRETICRGLFVFGHEVVAAGTAEEAVRRLAASEDRAFDLLVTDLRDLDAPGLDLLAALRRVAPSISALVTTGLTRPADVAALRELGHAVLVKPFTPDELDAAVRAAGGGREPPAP
jgi:DNA-binding response OmpR family regulator